MPRIQVNEVALYYELHGGENAPLLVLNNGIIMNATMSWAFQTKALAETCNVLQYDCRGQGQSEHPDGPYSMELHADDLAGLLSALGYEQAHIAGISYGGEVAQAFALKYPERTSSLILADTISQVGPELRIIVEAWLDAARSGSSDTFFNATDPWNFSAAFIAASPGLLADAMQRYKSLDYAAVIRLYECFLDVDFTDRLAEIKCMTCIIVGAEDLLKGTAYTAILRDRIAQSELHILQDVEHAICWESPQAFNTVVLGFLAKQQA